MEGILSAAESFFIFLFFLINLNFIAYYVSMNGNLTSCLKSSKNDHEIKESIRHIKMFLVINQ